MKKSKFSTQKKKTLEIFLRTILITIGVLGNIVLLTPFFLRRILNIGNLTGSILMCALIVYGLFYPKIHATLHNFYQKKVGKFLLRTAVILLSFIFVLAITETGLMIAAASKTPSENATVVVLGCRAYGTRPSIMLASRLDAAYEYLTENPSSMCIVSGGQGADEEIPEAECMYLYLTERGIAPERILMEPSSTSTRENLSFSLSLIEEHGLNPEVAIVTNEYHEYRAGMIASALNMDYSAIPADTPLWLLPTYYIRELYGILYEWVF